MDKAVVTALGAAALACAVTIAVRWGGLDTSVRSPQRHPITAALRRLCIVEVSGITTGLLVGGFGSRLMMRIIAATSAPQAQGRITEAEEVVGRVTSGGTIGLLIFVGVLSGVLGAAIYAIIGRWLPRRAWLSGGVLGLLLLGVFARRDPLSPDNLDFTFLSPVALAVAMIVVLFVLYGMTLVALVARLERSYPPFERRALALIAYVPLLFLLLPPLPIALVGALAVGAIRGGFPDLGRSFTTGVVPKVAWAVVGTTIVAGNIWLSLGLAEILF